MGKISEFSVNDRMSDDEIRDTYFQWLRGVVLTDQTDDRYTVLQRRLHSTEFIWFVPNDDNREYDGIKLRDVFCDDLGLGFYENSSLQGPCSVFEMLIGLAIRIADIMTDMEDNSHPGIWFWEMIRNLDLIDFDDANYNRAGGHRVVEDRLAVMISRGYGRKGDGGLFPVRYGRKDQRTVEIWYQMNTYLREKYRVDC